MDADTARFIFLSIMAVGYCVWLWSLARALNLGKSSGRANRLTFDEDVEYETEDGEVTVSGEPATVSKALIRSLRSPGVGIFGALFKVDKRSPKQITLEKTGPIICNQPPGLYFTEVELNFEPAGQGAVRVSYRLGYVRLVRLLKKIALGIIFGVGLPVMVIVGTIIWLLVVRSDNPSVRWQVFQTLQIGHALWPPFLFLRFYRLGRRQSRRFMENLIASAGTLE